MSPLSLQAKVLFTLLYLFLLAGLTHLLILLWLGIPLLRYTPHAGKSTPAVGFTVVVAAHNEAAHLRKLVPLLLGQDHPDFEVIIALDRCTDESRQCLYGIEDSRLKTLDLQEVPAGIHGKKHAITQAISAARHDWILLTDADCRPASARWISAFAAHAHPGREILLGVSPYRSYPGLLPALITYETFHTALFYMSAAIRGIPYMGVGRNLAYKRSFFWSSGGFGAYQGIAGGDDDLLVQQHATGANTGVVLTPGSLTYSAPKRKWKTYLRQKLRHLSVGKFYKQKVKIAHVLFASVHFLLWVSCLYLAFRFPEEWRIIGTFCLLVLVKGLFFAKIARKFSVPISYLWFPVTDLCYAVLIPLTGVRAFFVKNIRWK